jgi:hypothetical protein
MKLKYWLKYLIHITILFSLTVLRGYIEKLFSASYYRFDNPAILYYAIISLLLGACIGLFLGLEHFIKEIGNIGIWKINLPKLILIGIPALYFSVTNLLTISSSQFIHEIIAYPLLYLSGFGSGYVSIFQMILGYVIITSFFKYSENV